MGKKSGPPAPDYTAAAEKTAEGNLQNTNSQTAANRPNIYTPWGSQTWSSSAGTDPATGKPVTNWQSQITLSPQQQQALNEQMAIQSKLSTGAGTLADQAISSFQQKADWSNLPGGEDASAWRQKAQDAVDQLQAPMLARNRDQMEARLANQGITLGSEAWRDVQRQIGDNETRAGLSAIASGREEANLQNLSRQQAIAEMMMRRGQPLNELNALLTGNQVGMPQMPNFQPAGRAPGADYSGAAQQQYQAALDSNNARNGMIGNTLGGLFSLGSAAMGNPAGWGGLFRLG